jgi:ABC-type uncharacterized transport system permease subunit
MHGISLANVHTVCFAASYAIALVLEVSRLFLRVPIRHLGSIAFTVAGLLAHLIYILMRAGREDGQSTPLTSWYDWLLMVAWGVAMAYLVLALRRPQATAGIFALPLVLVLIAVASFFRDAAPFDRDPVWIWGMLHGTTLLLGSVFVMLGCISGVMYLVQSYRLKRKLLPRQGLKLPSLEWLQGANKLTLIVGSLLLAAGLAAGVMLNLTRPQRGMPWSDPVIWTSGILLGWLLLSFAFGWFYRPAQRGRKVAYLTLASSLFLALVLAMVLAGPSQHASRPIPSAAGPGEPLDSSPSIGGER